MCCRPSKGYDTNFFLGFHVDNRYRNAVQETESHETLFAIGEPVVFVGGRKPVKDPCGVHEVNAVSPKVCATLHLVPREPHIRSVYTIMSHVKIKGGN